MRKKYMMRFIFRVIVFLAVIGLYIFVPDCFRVLEKGQFFQSFSPLHLLWAIWLLDMILKLIQPGRSQAMGAVKQLKRYYRPAQDDVSREELRAYIRRSDRRAAPIFALGVVLGIVLGVLKHLRIFHAAELFLISVLFYVCDLICVLFWCPFRVFFMHNRCCTTCMIFNWDHLMMTTPLIAIGSFFSWTLVGMSIFMFVVWEYMVHRHPERFWERTNQSLRCSQCTDRLCGRAPRGDADA